MARYAGKDWPQIVIHGEILREGRKGFAQLWESTQAYNYNHTLHVTTTCINIPCLLPLIITLL